MNAGASESSTGVIIALKAGVDIVCVDASRVSAGTSVVNWLQETAANCSCLRCWQTHSVVKGLQ